MKKATLIISIFFLALSVKAQTKDSIPVEKVPLLSYEQYQEFNKNVLGELPAKYADVIRYWFEVKFSQLAAQYKQKEIPKMEKPKK